MSKVLIILADGFEEMEAIAPIDVLRRAEVEVVTASLKEGPVSSSRKVRIIPDTSLDKVDAESFDMVVLPGGQQGTQNLASDDRVKKIVQTMNKKNKYTAAICAAPFVLSEAGILQDKRVTSYPTMQPKLKAKEVVKNERVVVDGKVITSQGAGTSLEFGLKLVEIFRGKEKSEELKKAMIAN